jgi:hypothetical protein
VRAIDVRREIAETATLLWSFLRRPSIHLPRHAGAWLPVVPLLTIFAIDLGIDFLVSLMLDVSIAAGHEPPTQIPMDWTYWPDVFSLLLLAPVTEELQFRGWLNGHRRNLVLAAVVFPPAYALYLLPYEQVELAGWLSLATLVLLVAGSVWWARQPGGAETIPPWYARFFPVILWGSTLAFGVIHFALYSDFAWGLDLLYVVPQTLGGIMLAFTRLRLGLRAAMIHHALFNGYTGLYDLAAWMQP